MAAKVEIFVTNRLQDNGTRHAKSSTSTLPADFFRKLDARFRVTNTAELYSIGVGDQFKAMMELPLPNKAGVRRVSGETARVIKAEAFRLWKRHGSMRQMSRGFFMDKPAVERYNRYRAITVQHGGKIREFLRILKKQVPS